MNHRTPSLAAVSSSPIAGSPLAKFAAYGAARAALVAVAPLLGGWTAELRDQAHRAATSAMLNLAEGAGQPPRTPARRRHYRIALGSALELLAALDAASIVAPSAGIAGAAAAAQRSYGIIARLVAAQ